MDHVDFIVQFVFTLMKETSLGLTETCFSYVFCYF